MSGHTKMLPVLAVLILCPRAEAAEFEILNPTSGDDGLIAFGTGGKWGNGCRRNTADFNGDGYADLWANCNGKNYFMLSDQAGHFRSISAAADGHLSIGNGNWASDACRLNTGDFNGDGYADLWANCNRNNYFVYNNQAGHFRSGTAATDGHLSIGVGDWASNACRLNTGDFNGDGYSDLWANCNRNNYFLLNTQVGGFRSVSARADGLLSIGVGDWASDACRLNTGDFNGDGHSDLWANCGANNYFLIGKDGTFVSVSASRLDGFLSIGVGKWASDACRLNTGDYNADGHTDLWANCDGDNYFMRNTQDLRFAPLSATDDGYVALGVGDWASAACSLHSGDFDNDGPHDLWAHCGGNNYFLRRNFFSKYYLKYELVQNVPQQHSGDFVLETITSEDGGSIDNCFGDGNLQLTQAMQISQEDTTTLEYTQSFMNSYTASFTAGVSVTASVEADFFFGSASLETTVSFSTTQEWTAEESASNTKSFSETAAVARTQSHTATAFPRTCLKYEIAATVTKDPLMFNMISTMKLTVYPKAYMQNPAVAQIDDPAVLEFVMTRLPPQYTSTTIDASDSTIRFETGATVSSRYLSSASIRSLRCVCPE